VGMKEARNNDRHVSFGSRLLTKREVKMAGYRPSYFLRVYGPRFVSVHKQAKKERTNIQPS